MITAESIFYIFVLMIGPLAGLLLAVRLIAALFSKKVAAKVWNNRSIHFVWGCFAFVGVLVFFGFINNPEMWPFWLIERSIEQREHQAIFAGRLKLAGGWAAVQRDCDVLAEHYQGDQFQWFRGFDTNSGINTAPLPPSLAALEPMKVEFFSPEKLRPIKGQEEFKVDAQIPVVHIQIFGMHRTGIHDSPYLGFLVVCTTNAANHPEAYFKYQRVADRVYEGY